MLETPEREDSNLIDVKEFSQRLTAWTKKHADIILELGKRLAENNITWGSCVEENAQQYTNKIAIKFEDTTLTYKEFNELVNQYANYFISIGLKKNDVVKVLIKNRLEFLLVYTANAKIGAISSLINTDLRKQTLVYSLNHTPGKIVVVGEECFEVFNNVKTELNLSDAKKLCYIPDSRDLPLPEGFIDLPQVVNNFPVDNPSTTANVQTSDVLAYLFTSGTTGMPKAALLTHFRVIVPGIAFGRLIAEFTPDDIIYIPLPFFHGTSLMTGWSAILVSGGALALGRKFSARHFWDEVRKYNATSFSYVGEVCRYLMNQPSKPDDSDNSVRVIIGNGLRPEIWKDFKKRFDIPFVAEFYGSSEGNGGYANAFNFDCTCGYGTGTPAIVRYDFDEEIPIKNKRGFMRKVRRGEVGLLLFKSEGDYTFQGYTDKEATEEKIFRNVFRNGDAWFNTGDLMRDQGCNHAQFVDRLGDTFRWKGHNISTTQVEQVLNVFDHVSMSSVYGVKIPYTDGRAGMAAIVPKASVDEFDFKGFTNLLSENLAPYAIPLFLRFKSALSITHTFKFKKIELKKESIDIGNDPLYVLLPGKSEYVPLTKEIYENIQNQKYQF